MSVAQHQSTNLGALVRVFGSLNVTPAQTDGNESVTLENATHLLNLTPPRQTRTSDPGSFANLEDVKSLLSGDVSQERMPVCRPASADDAVRNFLRAPCTGRQPCSRSSE